MEIEIEAKPGVTVKEIEFSENESNINKNIPLSTTDKLLPERVSVRIRELIHPHFGCYLWSGSYVLASYIWYYRNQFINATTIELGSGVSLPSLLLAKLKHEYHCRKRSFARQTRGTEGLPPTIITDISSPKFILKNIKKEVRLNGLQLNPLSSYYEDEEDDDDTDEDFDDNENKNDETIQDNVFVEPLYWGIHDTLVDLTQKLKTISSGSNGSTGSIDYILAADNFFIPKDYEDILSTVSFIFRNYPQAKFITTYQERSAQRTIQHLLEEWHMKATLIPLPSFNCHVSDLVEKEMVQTSTTPTSSTSTTTTSNKNDPDNNLHFGGSIYSIFLIIIEPIN